MKYSNAEKLSEDRKNKNFQMPNDPVKVFGSLILLVLILFPNYIWAGIQCLLARRKKVNGQVVLITGTARGLGRELALAFHRLGAKIVCVDRNGDGNAVTAEMISGDGGTVKAFTLDITDREKIRSMHEVVKRDFGPVDILVNNAAVVRENIYVNPKSDKLVKEIIEVNLLAQFWMNKEILPSMLDRNSGQIVVISSLLSLIGTHSLSAYVASKWGVTGMMESLDQELNMLRSKVVLTTACPYFMEANPEITKNINVSFPMIPLRICCDQIVDGILKNKKVFTVPSYLYLPFIFYKILPSNLQYYTQDLFGSSYRYGRSDYEILKKYERD